MGQSTAVAPNYQVYLRSDAWSCVRKEQLAWDEYRCRLCGRQDVPLEVHHTDYEHLGNERIGRDLLSLCIECHDVATSKIRSDRYARRDPIPSSTAPERHPLPKFVPTARPDMPTGSVEPSPVWR